MQTVDHAEIGLSTGVRGDFRGALKPGRNKRQVTVMTAAGWGDAIRELGVSVAWELRRVNLLVDGLDLEETRGATLTFAGGAVLEITGECDPCSRMEEIAPGLKAALLPHWRGGVTTIVKQEGRIAVGDSVRIDR
ncbi:MAG: MOSC domain-containing protein [Sphingomonas sp.]|nr:MOSC domain-containing protein [Sphingomonas sp.]PZU09889.1 MAG: MOSC domain-containing protein [Sphingomonas sp.]